MKKIICPLVISLIAVGAFSISARPVKSVSAATNPPTEIDLNDCSESEIRNYYSGLNSLSETERQGTNLLKNLKPILSNGQVCYQYGKSATTAVWQAYEIIDRDWTLSPASEITGYNASTNKISGYTYGTGSNNVGSNPYIHALYVNRNAKNETQAWGDHTQTNYGINQEHVWPKSLGFNDDNNPEGARGDLMHLWAGNGRVNGQYHGNYFYGYVDKTKTYSDAGNDYSYLAGNLQGYSKTSAGSSVLVFEPQDSDKGDIARSIFYMMARYNYLSGSDSKGISSANPNLEITNDLGDFSKTGYTSSETQTGKIGILQDLLEWNKLDPVDEFEIHRNNLLYRNFSFNRNPFIDFPEWADYVWGTSSNGTYNPAVSGSAAPANDEINKGGEHVDPPQPQDNGGGLDLKTIIIIAAVAVVVVVVLIIIFANLSKKNKKKVLKKAKKSGKKQVKNYMKKK